MGKPLATMHYDPEHPDDALEFLKRTRSELRSLSIVRVWPDRFCVFDVNKDFFEITGVGYPDDKIIPILQAVNTAFNPTNIHDPAPGEYKEFKTGRRYPWAADRVM